MHTMSESVSCIIVLTTAESFVMAAQVVLTSEIENTGVQVKAVITATLFLEAFHHIYTQCHGLLFDLMM